jgi:hypothetical protein
VDSRIANFVTFNLLKTYCFLLIFTATVWGNGFSGRPVGIELEYAGAGSVADNTIPKSYFRLLEPLQIKFGGMPATIQAWNKFSHIEGLIYGSFADKQNRPWQIVPESVDGKMDGYELITPPLTTPEDGNLLMQVMQKLKKSGMLKRGEASSTHFTYDVSDLIDKKTGNISKLVDLILFLESNMVKIYNALGPKRLGSRVNFYSVPLGLTQLDLLKELASLPEHERTFDQVRSIFLKYHDREFLLQRLSEGTTWKYRSVNYGKFFGLGRFDKVIPVIEFRITDLVEPEELFRVESFLSKLIEVGIKTPQTAFIDPYTSLADRNINRFPHKKVESLFSSLPGYEYKEFIETTLGLSTHRYPQRYEPPLSSNNICLKIYMTP